MEPQYITEGGSDRAHAAAALHGEVFKTDPVMNYLLHTMQAEKRIAYFPRYLLQLMKSAAVNYARFDEAWLSEQSSDPKAPPTSSAVWMPPGRRVDSLRSYVQPTFWQMLIDCGIPAIKRMLGDFQEKANRAKRMGLVNADGSRIKAYWYLFFLSTDPKGRGKGLAGELIRGMQASCEEQVLPIWLESTTANSHRLYLKLGFKDVDTWILGSGEVDTDGITKKGGEGVRIWAMVWFPESWPKGSNGERKTEASS